MSSYQKLLIAVDLSEESEKICQKALALVGQDTVNVLLVHVVERVYQMDIAPEAMLYPAIEPLFESESRMLLAAQKTMAELLNSLSVPTTVTLDTTVLSGVSKTEILRLAREQQMDLIVCGSHGRSGFELLLGSTANAILHHAPCDVLAIRTSQQKT